MRFPSGVPGFDALIQGGFPAGAAVIVQGPAGREKDAFLLQFVADALRRGAAALVLLASVSPAKYEADLREAGVDVDLAIAEQRLRFVDWFTYKEEAVQDVEAEGPTFRASIDLANVGIAVSRAIAALPREGEKCAAIEILSPALSVYDLPAVYGFAQSTKAKLERFGFTGLFVLEKEMHDERTLSSLHQPFDGVVDIERVREGDSLVRKIAVLSLKGTAAQSKYVPIEVGEDRLLRVSTISDRERSLHKQEELIKSNPKDPKLWLATARNLNAMGERERALRCVEAALNLDPHDADVWRLKAEVLEAMGRKDEALNARTRAFVAPVSAVKLEDAAARLLGVVEPRLRLNPRDPDALFVKAAAQAKMEAIAEAIRTLEALVAVDEAYPGLWVLKAKLHARLGEREKAQESRQRATEVEKRLARERDAQRLPPPPPETAFECPECGAMVGEHDTVCPSCGVLFEVEGAPKPEVPPTPRPPPSPRPRPEVARPGMTNGLVKEKPRGAGRTNGLVNGTRGRTNGLVNGTRGRTNGLVNGTRGRTNGLVNGTRGRTNGLVNGTRGAGRTNGLVNGTRGRTNGLVNGTRGRTNGLVNGTRGRTNGLVNGTRGHTNGVTNGLVEGLRSLRSGMTNGLTNGSGFTNGLGSKRYSRESRRNRWKIFLIPLTFVLLVAIPFLSADIGRSGGPQIDGAFDDWAGAPGHVFPAGGPDPNVALDRVEFMNGTDAMFLLVQVQGTQILAGGPTPPGVMNAVYVFVDTDRDAATGYPIRGIGADRLVDIQGHGGIVMSAIAYSASQASPDRRDWRSWTDPAPIAAAASGNRLELAVDWLLLGDSPRSPVFLVASQGWDDTVDFAESALAVAPGVLDVLQRPIPATNLSGANVPLLSLTLAAADAPVTVSTLAVTLLGTAPVADVGSLQLVDATSGSSLSQRVPIGRTITFSFPAVTLAPGNPAAWTVTASVSGADGTTLGAEIGGPYAVGAASAAVTLSTAGTGERLGYVGRVPLGPVVDGAFAEWTNDTADAANEPTTGGNPSVDIAGFAIAASPSDLTFHVALRGPSFAGVVLTSHPNTTPNATLAPPDRDRDGVPDATDPLPDDFNNDGTPDALTNCDVDGDGLVDGTCAGPDAWLNTTIPANFPSPYAGRVVTIYIGPSTLPPMIGEDEMRLLVDADNVSATGFYSQGIGADYMVEVKGREGTVSSAVVYVHSGANPWVWAWTRVTDAPFALGLTQFEARANVTSLVPVPPVLVQMSDWRGGMDDLGIGTRGGTRSSPVFAGPDIAFVKSDGGAFAYRSTGGRLEAYAHASRGSDADLVLRYGSLFLGWKTTALGGVGDVQEAPSMAPTLAAGRSIAIGGFSQGWEEFAINETGVKHNVWLRSPPQTSSALFAVRGTLDLPENATVSVDGQAVQGSFVTDHPIVVAYDGYRVRLESPYAYESRNPSVREAGRYVGTVVGGTLSLSMAVSATWLRDPARVFPVVLDPSATGIVDTTTSTTPVGGPHQRNVFYDGTYFWAFYYDGSNIMYEPSSDGLSWVNTKNQAFTTASVRRVSAWFHSTGAIVYIAGDTGAGLTSRARRGTISGTTITWGTEATVTTAGKADTRLPFITRDASGYIWIGTNSKETNTLWYFAAVRSTNTDDVSAWGTYADISASTGNNNIQGVILPLASGDMYGLWYRDGPIEGKRYTASNSTWWTSGDTIDTTSSADLTKAPSAVVDGSFNIHLTYVDSSGAVKYRQRTSSWGSATTLDAASGNTYATISRDTGTGDLYVFYISTSNQIKAQKYSGSWSAVTLETNTKSKSSLTSSYSAASSSNIAWTWGQGTSSPYDVKISVLSTSLYSRTIDTSTDANANPVSYNHQRKIFHDGAGYFWAFYFDGSNTFTTMSADGMTWELMVWQMFTTAAIDNPSVWFHDTGTTKIVYLVGDDTSTNDHQLTVRRCTISGTTPTCGSDTAVTFTGQGNMAGMIAFITKDTNGRLWIISNDSPSVSNYNVGVVRSTNADDVSSWGSVTNLMSASISTNNIFPTVLPQSGGDMYAIWYANGNIQGRKYTASNTTWWNTVETIASTTSGVTTKIPSATVDSSDNVDIVYIDSSGAVIHKQRTSSWGSADTVDSGSGNTSPTITLESSTGDLYVFYLQSTGQIKGRKLHTGPWSDMTTGVDTNTITKAFITSPYTVDAAWKVAWEWDQVTTSPYEIKVAHIPEFGDLLPPIAMTIVIILSVRGRRRSRGQREEAAA